MMSKAEVVEWIGTLSDTSSVAIDEGGLTLVEIDVEGVPTRSCIEIGGVPDNTVEE